MFKSVFPKFLMVLSILGASILAVAQTQAVERQSLPPRGRQKYWLVVDEFADRAVHFAYAKRFVQLHEGLLTYRQCHQYSRIAVDYREELAAVKQVRVSDQSEFWNDVRIYSIIMIGPPGVPIPIHRTSTYWVTTGSEAEAAKCAELSRLKSMKPVLSWFRRQISNAEMLARSVPRGPSRKAVCKPAHTTIPHHGTTPSGLSSSGQFFAQALRHSLSVHEPFAFCKCRRVDFCSWFVILLSVRRDAE